MVCFSFLLGPSSSGVCDGGLGGPWCVYVSAPSSLLETDGGSVSEEFLGKSFTDVVGVWV